MVFLGLAPRAAALFLGLMAVSICLFMYAWQVATSTALPVGQPPSPTVRTPGVVTIDSCGPGGQTATPVAGSVFEVERYEVGIEEAQGLAYHPADRSLVIGRAIGDATHVETFTLFGDHAGSRIVEVASGGDLFWDRSPRNLLFSLDVSGRTVDIISVTPNVLEAVNVGSVDLRAAGVGRVSGLDMDETTSSMVLVDAPFDRLLRVDVRQLSRGGQRPWQVAAACEIPLPVLRDANEVVVAVRPHDGAVFLAEAGGNLLYEVTRAGSATRAYDLTAIGIAAVRGLAFAPSSNPNRSDGTEYLYVLDGGSAGAVVSAVTFEPVEPAGVPTTTASVVQTIDLAQLDPPSSDPGGVAYEPGAGRVIVTDSEIDELLEFRESTVFARGTDGSWEGLGTPASHEGTDIAIDSAGNQWFFTDDGQKALIIFDLGVDQTFGTRDDRVRKVATTPYGIDDPEGLAFGQGSLFMTDGADSRVYRVMTGPNGRFDGGGDRTDDSITGFDTSVHGVSDPEGVAFDASRGTLFIISRDRKEPIIEVGTDGRLVRRIVIPEGALISPGGIAVMPPGASGDLRLLVADRGADNGRSPDANDGRLIELDVAPP